MIQTDNDRRILAIHDLSGFGHTSLMAVIPLIYAHGMEVCVLPSSLLSSNTCYDGYRLIDTGDFMKDSLQHYKELGLSFSAIFSGFLGGPNQVCTLLKAIDDFGGADVFVLIDPVMADEGELYSCYDDSMIEAMRRLISKADIITPNYTEACFLADLPLIERVDTAHASELCNRLHKLGAKEVIITSAPDGDDYNAIVYSSGLGALPTIIPKPYLPTFYTGAGDMFSTLTLIYALKKIPREEGITRAADYIYETIKYSHERGRDGRSGVILQDFIKSYDT